MPWLQEACARGCGKEKREMGLLVAQPRRRPGGAQVKGGSSACWGSGCPVEEIRSDSGEMEISLPAGLDCAQGEGAPDCAHSAWGSLMGWAAVKLGKRGLGLD